MANRNFQTRQALEKEMKDLYSNITFGASTAATATLDLTEDIVLTSVAAGDDRNDETFTVQVAAAADNPTDTVLAVFSGTAAAITVTITPNDGTNNSATPVNLTTAELVELINDGSVTGKNVTVTDTSSLRALQTATGGDTTPLADSGEGDGVAATFANGAVADPTVNDDLGFSSVARSSKGVFLATLPEKYNKLRSFSGMILLSTVTDTKIQLVSEAMATAGTITFRTITGTTLVDPSSSTKALLKMEVRNSSV